MQKLTVEIFCTKARVLHGDKYDYSKVEYVNSHSKITIGCPVHGYFQQTPNAHLHSLGCAKCAFETWKASPTKNARISQANTLSQEEFISKARSKHGERYNYSMAVYRGSGARVKIICSIHGEFEQRAADHMAGGGCELCARNKLADKLRLSNDDFIQASKMKFGDRFTYDKTNYIDCRNGVIVTCKEHGDFSQLPSVHLRSNLACPECRRIKQSKSLSDFILQAEQIHKDRYDYSKSVYQHAHSKIEIICKEQSCRSVRNSIQLL